MNGDLIELDETLLLGYSLFNKHCIEILHIGKAYQFVDRGVIADISFEVRIGIMPLFCSHAKHGHIKHIGFIGINDTCLNFCNFGRYEIVFYGIGMDSVVYF